LCYRSLAGWTAGCYLGPLVTPVDDRGLGFPDARYCPGQLVGLLRTRLGWLVVLGSCGKCLLHALASRYRIDALACRHRKTWRVQELDRAAGYLYLFAVPAGHLPRALWYPDVSARLRQ